MLRRMVILETSLVVAVIVIIKTAVHFAGLEIMQQNALFTSLIAGAIFLFGLILSGTLSEYKESDKMPAEFVASLESVAAEVRATQRKNPDYDGESALLVLADISQAFRASVNARDYDLVLDAVGGLTAVFAEMEENGGLPQYMSRVRNDQATLTRIALRIAHIDRTDFIPSARLLLQTIVWLVIAILVFTTIEPPYLALVLTAFVAFMFEYMLRLQSRLERPFRPAGSTRDDVSLFLLKDFEARIREVAASRA